MSGLEYDGACQRDALLLAAGQLMWASLAEALETDQRQRLTDPAGDLGGGSSADSQWEGDVLEDRHMGKSA